MDLIINQVLLVRVNGMPIRKSELKSDAAIPILLCEYAGHTSTTYCWCGSLFPVFIVSRTIRPIPAQTSLHEAIGALPHVPREIALS